MEHQHRIHDTHGPEERARMLGGKQRREWLKVDELFAKAGISSGMTCIDLGCGAGAVSVPLAEKVGPVGKIYAVDRDPQLLAFINGQDKPENLVTVESDAADTGLEPGIADACFTVMVLHEVDAEAAIGEAYRLLKSGGRIVIIEWRLDNGRPHPPLTERIPQEKMKELLTGAGFTAFESAEWTDDLYMAMAVK